MLNNGNEILDYLKKVVKDVEISKKIIGENKQTKFIIYTAPECNKCEAQKEKWNAEGILFEERAADRIKNHQDKYDREAHVEAAFNNEQLPVIVKREDVK